MERPHEIKATHLARKALVYVRQSSEAQVRDNRGSAEYQRNLAQLAGAWGWAHDQIELVEDDLGRTATAAEHRGGLRRMVAMIAAGEVGAVFVGDDSRLSRAAFVTLGLLDQCVAKHVLLIKDHKVLDLADPTGYFHACLGAILAEYDNNNRREHIRRGRDARVKGGKAVSRPPTGYVTGDDGDWQLDPDPDVQAVIKTVYRVFLQERSCRRTIRALRAMGLMLPRRRSKRTLVWVWPSLGSLGTFLKNPGYTGDYVYRQKIVDRAMGRNGRGSPRLRRATPDETVVIAGHHAAYVSRAEWEEIQAVLRAMAPSMQRRNLGPGHALLQGIVRCDLHRNGRMRVIYRGSRSDGHRLHYYGCMGEYAEGGRLCGPVTGGPLDRAVVEAVLERLTPPRIAAIREAWHAIHEHQRDEERLATTLLHRTRRHVEELERRYMLVDPANRLVAAGVESQLEHAKRELLAREVEAGRDSTRPDRPTAADLRELEGLTTDVRRLFRASTTTDRDRKEVLRAFIDHVAFEGRSREWIHACIRWADGYPDTVLRIPGSAYGRLRLIELGRQGCAVDEVHRRAEEEGWTTRRGTPWTRARIQQALQVSR
jgi:DNA invertase Pin-like site-specific DNA recombinase